jgi:hypothetical protein
MTLHATAQNVDRQNICCFHNQFKILHVASSYISANAGGSQLVGRRDQDPWQHNLPWL